MTGTIIITFLSAILCYDFLITILPKIVRKTAKKEKMITADESAAEKILEASIHLLSNGKADRFWGEKQRFTLTQSIINFIRRTKPHHADEFEHYNYPKAFLLSGIARYLKKNDDLQRLSTLKSYFDRYIDADGKALFKINRVDQSAFGTASLLFFQLSGEVRYLNFAQHIKSFIFTLIDPDTGLIKYRPDSYSYFNDTLGMAIPFLTTFASVTGDMSVIAICKKQIDFFNLHGTDHDTQIPAHGVNWKKNNIKVGSANWGRGIGWYYYGLASLNSITKDYDNQIHILKDNLFNLRNKEGLWTQFPGSSEQYDASATTMILSSITMESTQMYSKSAIIKLLKNYIDENGYVLQTSGDTENFNRYASSFGKSELSQGFLLIALSHVNE